MSMTRCRDCAHEHVCHVGQPVVSTLTLAEYKEIEEALWQLASDASTRDETRALGIIHKVSNMRSVLARKECTCTHQRDQHRHAPNGTSSSCTICRCTEFNDKDCW